MAQQPLERVSLIDSLVSRLEQDILAGTHPVGSRLPSEEELARELGVSRPVIREGLSRLRERGYLQTVSGRGTYVRLPDADQLSETLLRQIRIGGVDVFDVDNLYEARTAIEVTTARLAARRATEDNLETLRRLLAEMRDSTDEPSAYTAADMSFHIEVANAAHNPFLSLMLRPLAKVIIEGIFTSSQSDGVGVSDGIRMHTEVLAAIEDHDPDRAAEAMSVHLVDSRRVFPDSVLSQRSWLS